jgi:hypothetical protein
VACLIICKKLDIPVTPEDNQENAEDAMLQDDQRAALDAEQAAEEDAQAALSDQAEASLQQQQPGYIQDTLNQFNTAE